jgi:VWFA-related protein
MKLRFIAFLIAALAVSPLFPALSQTPSRSDQQDDERIRVGTTEVALDIVVRDKKGRPVRDLTAADFEIYEDGVRQQIKSFRLVSREEKRSGGVARQEESRPEPANAPRGATQGASVIALVFDRLKPEARALARKAALAYAEESIRLEDFTGVFAIDLSLRIIQPFTDNPKLVSQAIDHATTLSTSTFASNREPVRNLSSQIAGLERSGAASEAAAGAAGGGRDSAGAASAGGAAGAAAAEMALAQMNQRMLETFETLERNQQGYATIHALLAVIDALRNLPGRKTVIFFSEGLALPPAVHARFRSVVHAANRAGVSIYPIDAAGLRAESTSAETAREINDLAARRLQQLARSRDDGSGPLMRSLERNEDLLRLDPHTGLGQLADQTGGFLIADTNDLRAGLRRIDEDMRVHYVLTYSPTNQEYDGKFRNIAVKLSRSNLDVQTRKGYYAIDPTSTIPVLDYEIPALAALNAARRASANPFTFRLAGFHFPETSSLGLAPVLAEVPMSAFTFAADENQKTYHADFSIVALVRDESRQVVQKLSQHYPLSGPMDRLESARKGEVIFYREAELPPGRYTIEAVAYDALTGRASMHRSSLEVPGMDETKLRLSSLVLLKRADRLTAEERKKENPFHFGEVVLYPNLGEPLHKSAVKQLAFFFTAWPAKGSTEKLRLTIEVLQNGRRAGQTATELPAADENGRIKYASALPLDNFQPGGYELKVTVKDGQSSLSRSAQFSVEP